jgi:hypothetical protein
MSPSASRCATALGAAPVELGTDLNLLEKSQQQVPQLVAGANLIRPVEFTSVAEAVGLAWHGSLSII